MSYEQGQLFEEDELPVSYKRESESSKRHRRIYEVESAEKMGELEEQLKRRVSPPAEELQKFDTSVNTFLFAQCLNRHSHIIELSHRKNARKLVDDIMLTAAEYSGKYPRDVLVSDLYSLFEGIKSAYSTGKDKNLKTFERVNGLSKFNVHYYESLRAFLRTFY